MNKKEILQKLYSFKALNKYATFGKAQPGIIHSPDDQQETISAILDHCVKELAIEIECVKRPTRTALQEIIAKHMDAITTAKVDMENRDFGYHLCWFLAEKVGIDLWRRSHTKVWGYWVVQDSTVKTVIRLRRRKSDMA